MKLKNQGKTRFRLFSVTISLGEGANPPVCRDIVDAAYQRTREPFSARDVHGTWSAAYDIGGRPELVFSGYVMPPMKLFGRRKRLVRVLAKIAERMANYVPLSTDILTNISVMCGRRHYYLRYH